jgi:hypothetical protein
MLKERNIPLKSVPEKYNKHNTTADQKVYWARFDGSSWSMQQVIDDVKTRSKPALVIYFL